MILVVLGCSFQMSSAIDLTLPSQHICYQLLQVHHFFGYFLLLSESILSLHCNIYICIYHLCNSQLLCRYAFTIHPIVRCYLYTCICHIHNSHLLFIFEYTIYTRTICQLYIYICVYIACIYQPFIVYVCINYMRQPVVTYLNISYRKRLVLTYLCLFNIHNGLLPIYVHTLYTTALLPICIHISHIQLSVVTYLYILYIQQWLLLSSFFFGKKCIHLNTDFLSAEALVSQPMT